MSLDENATKAFQKYAQKDKNADLTYDTYEEMGILK